MANKLKILKIVLACFVGTAAFADTLTVLTYSSMMGKSSFGEFLQEEYPKLCGGKCKLNLIIANDAGGLLGRLRKEARKNTKTDANNTVVLGLTESDLKIAIDEKLVADSMIFQKSSFAWIVDTKRFPHQPKTWKELAAIPSLKLGVQDPRTSNLGLALLAVAFDAKKISSDELKILSRQRFPSWSASYDAFEKGLVDGVWSYQTSALYHLCETPPRSHIKALELEGGYPESKEFLAWAGGAKVEAVTRLKELLKSKLAQEKVIERNWMLPVVDGVALPSCAQGYRPPPVMPISWPSFAERKRWMDVWSLL